MAGDHGTPDPASDRRAAAFWAAISADPRVEHAAHEPEPDELHVQPAAGYTDDDAREAFMAALEAATDPDIA